MPSPLDIPLRWFRRVRYAQWACQLALCCWARFGLELNVHVGWIGLFITIAFASDGLAWAWQRRGSNENDVLALMLLDAALHTGVFALSGGAFNPFTVLYLVNVVLAGLLLSRVRQWLVFAAQLLGFGALFLVERLAPATLELPNHQQLMRLHLNGMWLGFVIASGFIVYFVQRVLGALSEERRRGAQHEKLAALTTLAAGAAHELATPLGTIAIASREMQRALDALDVPKSLKEDALLVREQVERCRTILQSMSARSGELTGEGSTTFPVQAWVDDALVGVERSRVTTTPSSELPITGPRAALVQALRNLVKNALEASSGPVQVAISQHDTAVQVTVRDQGPGLDAAALERVGEPFFTTKPPGAGIGLGVFLARSLAEQLGGSLEFVSKPGAGTSATLSIPGSHERA
jgi:two-component system, sensor histidine kinase RegB